MARKRVQQPADDVIDDPIDDLNQDEGPGLGEELEAPPEIEAEIEPTLDTEDAQVDAPEPEGEPEQALYERLGLGDEYKDKSDGEIAEYLGQRQQQYDVEMRRQQQESAQVQEYLRNLQQQQQYQQQQQPPAPTSGFQGAPQEPAGPQSPFSSTPYDANWANWENRETGGWKDGTPHEVINGHADWQKAQRSNLDNLGNWNEQVTPWIQEQIQQAIQNQVPEMFQGHLQQAVQQNSYQAKLDKHSNWLFEKNPATGQNVVSQMTGQPIFTKEGQQMDQLFRNYINQGVTDPGVAFDMAANQLTGQYSQQMYQNQQSQAPAPVVPPVAPTPKKSAFIRRGNQGGTINNAQEPGEPLQNEVGSMGDGLREALQQAGHTDQSVNGTV